MLSLQTKKNLEISTKKCSYLYFSKCSLPILGKLLSVSLLSTLEWNATLSSYLHWPSRFDPMSVGGRVGTKPQRDIHENPREEILLPNSLQSKEISRGTNPSHALRNPSV